MRKGDETHPTAIRRAAALTDLCREVRVSSQATTHERQSVRYALSERLMLSLAPIRSDH
jgi:hypothetical protein